MTYPYYVATSGVSVVALDWATSVGTEYYGVYRSLSSGSGYSKLTNAMSNNHRDETGVVGTKYYYKVTAINSGGESGYSNEVNGTSTNPEPVVDEAIIAARTFFFFHE